MKQNIVLVVLALVAALVGSLPAQPQQIFIYETPQDQNVRVGETASLGLVYPGPGDHYEFRWLRDGQVVLDWTLDQSSIRFDGVDKPDEGTYSVQIRKSWAPQDGFVVSQPMRLFVNSPVRWITEATGNGQTMITLIGAINLPPEGYVLEGSEDGKTWMAILEHLLPAVNPDPHRPPYGTSPDGKILWACYKPRTITIYHCPNNRYFRSRRDNGSKTPSYAEVVNLSAAPKSYTPPPPPTEHFLFRSDLNIQDMNRCGATVQSVAAGDTVALTVPFQAFPVDVEWYHNGVRLAWMPSNDNVLYQPPGWPWWTVSFVIPNAQAADAGHYSAVTVVGTNRLTNNFRVYVDAPLHVEMLWISEGLTNQIAPNMGLLLVGDPEHPAPRYVIQYSTDLVNWWWCGLDVTPALTYPPTCGNGKTGANGPVGAWTSSGDNTAIIWLRYWGGNRWFRAVPQPF